MWLRRARRRGRCALDDGTADFCFDPALSPDGIRVVWMAWNVPDMPWDRARLVTYDRRTGGARRAPRRRVGAAAALAGRRHAGQRARRPRLVERVARRPPLVAEPFEHAGPSWGQGQRSYAGSPDGDRRRVHAATRAASAGCASPTSPPARCASVARGVHGQLSWAAHRLAAVRSGRAHTDAGRRLRHGDVGAPGRRRRAAERMGGQRSRRAGAGRSDRPRRRRRARPAVPRRRARAACCAGCTAARRISGR